jgi:hypothetical protein
MLVEHTTHQPFREWVSQNTRLLLRIGVALLVVLVSAVLARRPSLLFVALPIGIGGALILLRWPRLGLLAAVAGALIVPVGIGTGSESEINPPMLLIGAVLGIWLLDMIRHHEIRLAPSRTMLPVMLLVLAALLSFGMGQLPWFIVSGAPIRAQIGGTLLFVLSAGAFLVVSHMITDVRWLQRLVWVFLALGSIYMLGRVLPPLNALVGRFYTVASVGGLFWTWLAALSFSQAAFNTTLRPIWRAALAGLCGLTMVVGMTQDLGWTSGWAPALVAIGVTVCVARPRFIPWVILLGALVLVLKADVVMNLLNVGDNAYSALTRVEAWRILFKIIEVSPILGLGPANYYFYTPLFSILGYYVKFNSHNNYIDLVAQTGVVGLACFLWFCVAVGVVGWRLRTRVSAGFSRAYVYGALGGLAGTMVAGILGDWILPFVYNIGFAGFRASVMGWVFLGGLVALEQITRRQASQTSTAPQNVSQSSAAANRDATAPAN